MPQEKDVPVQAVKNPRNRKLGRPVALAGWGFFLIWIAIVKLGGYGAGAVLLGAGSILILCQGARHSLSLPAQGSHLLAGILLLCAGLWGLTGKELQLLPLILLAAGVAILVSSWRGFTRRR